MGADKITQDDLVSYSKILRRCNELANKWLLDKGRDVSGFRHTSDLEFDFENGYVYFTIHWQDNPVWNENDYYEFEPTFSIKEFIGE